MKASRLGLWLLWPTALVAFGTAIETSRLFDDARFAVHRDPQLMPRFSRSPRRRRGLAAAALSLALLPASLLLPVRAATTDERPAVIGRRVLGHSVQGRPIVAWHLGEPGKPKVVLISVMHGNEPAPRRILTDLRDGYPVHDVNLWVVPVYNPDGLADGTRKNAHGVDLNRNFPYRWADLDGDYESGPRAASEPETRAMMERLGYDPDPRTWT